MSYHAHFHNKIHAHDEEEAVLPLIDAHLHFVDFIQDSDGIQRLLRAMKAANVSKAVVFGLPLKKKWESFEPRPPHYYLDDNSRCYYFNQTDEILAGQLSSLTAAEQSRFAPLLCGFNPTDKYCALDVERMLAKYPFWKGIGELLLRHDDLTNLTNEEVARVNHPALSDVYELCASKNLPVMLHQNSTSVSIHDEYEHLHEMEEVLEKFPRTTFVWAHCGISRRVFHKNYHEMVSTLLSKHETLYIDISWVVYDDVICNNLEPKRHWLDLVRLFPERIFIGSDLCGHFDHLGKTVARYNKLLKMVGDRVSEMIAFGNAERFWFS